jgi:hypothetical protein
MQLGGGGVGGGLHNYPGTVWREKVRQKTIKYLIQSIAFILIYYTTIHQPHVNDSLMKTFCLTFFLGEDFEK